MTLYRPGVGTGRSMHIRRVRALQAMEKRGLLVYRSYSAADGYLFTTAAGEDRSVAATEMAAYMAGMADFYWSMRLDVDEQVGDEALEALDDKYLDLLDSCLRAVLHHGD